MVVMHTGHFRLKVKLLCIAAYVESLATLRILTLLFGTTLLLTVHLPLPLLPPHGNLSPRYSLNTALAPMRSCVSPHRSWQKLGQEYSVLIRQRNLMGFLVRIFTFGHQLRSAIYRTYPGVRWPV